VNTPRDIKGAEQDETESKNESFRMKSEGEISDWVKDMVAVSEPAPDFDHKAEYRRHIEEKYSL
jgi:hypothetical protein